MRSSLPVSLLLAVSTAPFAPAQGTEFFDSSTVVNLGSGNAWAPTLSADGLEMVFSSNRAGGAGGWDLWTAKRPAIDKPWGPPTNLSALNTSDSDFEPNLSADGLELYFVSTRPGRLGVSDVMVATRLAPPLPWSAPKFLGGPINAAAKAIDDPALTEDMLTIFYTVGVSDIYYSTRASKSASWGNEMPFAPANNLGAGEHSATPHANGKILVFASNVSGGAGSADFYIVWQDSVTKAWSKPSNLKELNKSSWDSNAFWSDTDGRIYWSDWASSSQPVVRSACYKLASVSCPFHPATSLLPYARSYWPTPATWAWRWEWQFSSSLSVDFYDCRNVTTWFVGVALKRGPGVAIPGTLVGGLELDPATQLLVPFAATAGLPFSLPITVPKAGSFPAGTIFYLQGFGIDGAKIISSDLYEAEVR